MLKIKIFHNKYYKLLVLAGFIWGFYPLIFNQSLLYLSVLSLLAGRFLVGSIILFIRNQKNRLFHYRRPDKKIITYSIFASIVPLSFFTVGLSLTTPLHASLLSLSLPFFVYLLAAFFFKDPVHKKVVFGGALATVGLMLIIFNQTNNNDNSSLMGDLMILLSNISAALSTIIARKLISTKHVANPDQLAFYDYSVAALFFCGTFLVQALFSGNLPEISFAGLFWVVTAATLGGVVPYLYFLKSARGLPAEKLADSNYISPITGAVAALILTGATLTVNDFLGLSIALIGLALGNNKLAPILHMPNTESIMNLEKTIIQKSVELEKVLIEGPKSKF